MATKINPLDFGNVIDVNIETYTQDFTDLAGITTSMTMMQPTIEVTIRMHPKDAEQVEIIQQAMLDSIEGGSNG